MKPIYGLTHIAKLEIEAKKIGNVISTEQYNHKGIFSITIEFDTTEQPVDFMTFNRLVRKFHSHITQVAARENSIVAFFIDQEEV